MGTSAGREDVRFDGQVVGAIYLRGAIWWFDYRPTPAYRKQLTLRTGDRREAARLAEDYAAQHSGDDHATMGAALPARKVRTLAAALEAYAKDRAANERWNTSTADRALWTLERFLVILGAGEKSPAVLSRERIKHWIGEWKKTNAPATVNSDFGRVRAFCNWLAREGHISARLDLTEIAMSRRAVRVSVGKRSLSPGEVAKVARHLLDSGAQYWLEWFSVAVGTGLRPAELAHLRARDFDVETQTLYVREQEDWLPKTEGSVRRVILKTPDRSMAPEVAEILSRRKKGASEDAFLFPAFARGRSKKLSDKAWRRDSLHHALQTACEGSGVAVAPYWTRHTFGRRAMAAKWNANEVRLILGHSSVTMTENYCKEVEPEEAREAAVLPSVLSAAALVAVA